MSREAGKYGKRTKLDVSGWLWKHKVTSNVFPFVVSSSWLAEVPWQAEGLSRADRIIAFCEAMPITRGHRAKPIDQDKPWDFETFELMRFQKDFIAKVYDDDYQVRQAVLSLPRKNGKSGLAALLALAHFVGPEAQPRGENHVVANSVSQAKIVQSEMHAIIKRVYPLSNRVVHRVSECRFEDTETDSTFEALSSLPKSKHGLSSSFWIYDELGQAANRELFDVMSTSSGAWDRALSLIISTQSGHDEHVMSELYDRVEKINDGLIEDPHFAGLVMAAPEDEDLDIFDEEVWYSCNPALGVFRSLIDIEAKARRLKDMPSEEPSFRNLFLNQRRQSTVAFLDPELWRSCRMTIDLDSLRGEDAFVGLDLSTVNDLCAAAVYLPRQSVLLARAWCPARRLTERSRMDGVPYELWRNKGFLHTTKSSERAIDKRELVEDFIEWISPFNVIELAYDRWGIAEFKRILADIDIDLPLAEHGQGFKDMSPATKAFQTLVLNQSIKHDGNPILTWCITNVVLSGDAAGNVKPDKRRATERIDVAVAAIMAVGAANKRAPDERLWTPETRIV